jgi:TRAP-type C4-dicarboxylate transport system permease small subunit
MIHRLGRILSRIEGAMTLVAATLLFSIMLLVVADVFMRYVVGRPFTFTYDLVGVYFMTGVFYLVLSHAQTSHAHVAVDILLNSFPEAARRIAEIVACIAGGSVFTVITYVGWERALDNYVSGDVLAGVIPWPTWASAVLVPVGAGVLVLRLALTALGHAASLITGQNLIDLPPLSGHAEAETFE